MVNDQSRSKLSIRRVLQRTWTSNSHRNSTHHSRRIRHRYHLCIWALTLCPTTAFAQANATANPVANSTGSVTNQAIQMLTGPYPSNSYGPAIQCMGPSLNISPFLTKSKSHALPFQETVRTPYYDPTDNDENGVPDNPGNILYYNEVPSGQKNNHALNLGITATISIPLDGGLQARCKASADTHNALQRQILANKRLDFELSRLRHCGTLAQDGIRFHPDSKFHVICSDVILTPKPGQVLPHIHKLKASKPVATSSPLNSSAVVKPSVPTPTPKESPRPSTSQ